MNSQQELVYSLIREMEDTLENGFSPFGPFSVVRKDIITNLLDKIYAALPDEIKEARALLRRKDELQYEAQQKAERIIAEAQAEANKLLSESDLLRAVQREAEHIKEQVISECDEIKRKAFEEADTLRQQALNEAAKIKEGASVYAEQLLAHLEQNLAQIQEIVKNGQVSLERQRMEDESTTSGNYANQQQSYVQDFRM